MRESSAALKQFLMANQAPTRPPDVGGDVQAQPPPGDALSYRIWATMLWSQGACEQRYHTQEMSAKARETLDKLPWEEALQKGGGAFVYRGVGFLTEGGILRWVAAKGNHVPVNAARSADRVQGRPPPPSVTFRWGAVSLWGPGQSPFFRSRAASGHCVLSAGSRCSCSFPRSRSPIVGVPWLQRVPFVPPPPPSPPLV